MRTMYFEGPVRTEIKMRHAEFAHEKEMHRLAQIATRNRPTATGRIWASVSAGLTRAVEKGSQAVRSVLMGPSEPSEQCC